MMFYRGPPERVRLGDLNLQNNNDGAHPVEFLVEEVIVHPNYIQTSKYNDIALLRLDNVVKFNDHIRPACLNSNDNLNYFQKATATGWGSIAFGNLKHPLYNICKIQFYQFKKKKNGVKYLFV